MNRKQRRELARQVSKVPEERKRISRQLKEAWERQREEEQQRDTETPTEIEQIRRRRDSGLYVVRRRGLLDL